MPALTKKVKLRLAIIAALLGIYSLAGFVVAPIIVRHLLENTVSETLKRPVSVERVRFNPYTFTLAVSNLALADEAAGQLVTLDRLEVNAQISSVFRQALVLKSVILEAPRIHIIRTAPDGFNFSDLMAAPTGPAPDSPDASAQAFRLVLGQLQISRGSLQFDDTTLEAPFASRLTDMALTITSLDTAPAAPPATVQFSGDTEAGEALTVRGRLDLQPLTAMATLDVRAVDLVKYAPYYRPAWNGELEKGRLDLETTAHWSGATGRLEETSLKLTDLEIIHRADGTPLLRIPRFQVKNAGADLAGQTVDLGRVTSRDGTLWIDQNPDGELNWTTALDLQAPSQTPPATDSPSPAAADAPPPSPWTVSLPDLSVTGYSVTIHDRGTTRPAAFNLTDLELTAKALSTRPDHRGEVSLAFDWHDQGRLKVAGQLGLTPVTADLKVLADGLDLRPLQPYVSDSVGLVITSGRFNTQGDLALAMSTKGPPALRYQGRSSLVDFKSVDAVKNADFFNFQSLHLNKLKLETNPIRLVVEEVALSEFYNKLLIAADGTSNIGTIFGAPAAGPDPDTASDTAETSAGEAAETGGETDPLSVEIRTVTLQGGSIDFTDLNIDPSVRLSMEKVGGRISGLDAIKEHQADVLLEGMVYGNVPIKISGKINPLVSPPYLDLKLDLTSADLTPFAPYAEKYLGYRLDKGLLSMDLTYLVEENRLRGENKAVLTQLSLGESVSSPSATSLPIKLAIALLKDRKGNIDIDLPVKGDLDDPEFSIGGIVLKMLGNLILDIVTSPFKVLGALFGGGESLSHIDFPAGVAALSSANKAKLDDLAKILYERPALNLEIEGRFDREEDTLGLRKNRFDQQLKAAKLKALMAAGRPARPLAEITISQEERDDIIRRTYEAADFPKPRDEKDQPKELPPAEMAKMLYTAIQVSDDDLRHLAHQRALATKTYLLKEGNVAPERLFVLEPKLTEGADRGTQESRVAFSLK